MGCLVETGQKKQTADEASWLGWHAAVAIALPFVLQSITASAQDARIELAKPRVAEAEALRRKIASSETMGAATASARGQTGAPLQYLALPVVVTVAAMPGVAVGYGVVHALHAWTHASWLTPQLRAHPSFAAKFYASDYDAVLVGVFAGVTGFVRYVTNPVLHSNTVYFARRRIARGKAGTWWHPPAYRLYLDDMARHADAQERARAGVAARSSVATAFLVGGWVLLFALAGYGYYVIRFIA